MTERTRSDFVEVLMVEDSPTQAEQLKHLLEESGFAVRVARNGRQALAMAEERTPTLMISDVVMPEMGGYELCREVKGRAGLKDLPVVLVTALSSPQDVIKGLECGADNFIRKPYDARELLSRIEYILNNRQVRAESKMQAGVQIAFGGKKYFITAERQQILDLLIATYEEAVSLSDQLQLRQAEIARSNQILQGLYRIAEGLNRSGSVREVLEKSLELALGFPEIQAGWISLWDSKQGFRLAAARNLPPALQSPGAWEGDCLCRRKLLAGELGPAVNVVECERLTMAAGEAKGLRVHASVPLRVGTRILGVLNLAGPEEGMFRKEDLELLADVGNQLAAALERAELLENLEWRVEERTAALEAEFAERQRAQDALRRSETRFRRLAESNMLGVMHTHFDGRFLDANDAFLGMVGYTRQELESGKLRWTEITPPEYRQLDERMIADVKKTGVSAPVEKEYVRKDGSRVPVLLGAALLEEATEEAICFALDLSSRRLLEEQLRQAQKMEAVGRLAGGVAHDFNNLLTIINGYAQLALEKLEQGNPLRPQLEEIKKAGDCAAALIRQLLAFGRRQVLLPQVLDLNEQVADMEKMLRRLIGEDVELAAVPAPDLARVKADAGQIEQVIMNLVVNARDAMPQGGKLTIETANVELDSAYERTRAGVTPGPYVMLAVTDTGVGMDMETLSHIFEPFFTTKEKGKGTGLGLATVYGIVKQSRGMIWVYSEVGRGTTFKIYFPRVDAAEELGKTEADSLLRSAGGSETVLLVEDEAAVRSLVRGTLESRGYRLLEARDGEDAWVVSRQHKGPIHLLLTDVVMPGMGGKELAECLAPLHREMKVLFMSGYASSGIVHNGELEPGTAFLPKPFSPDALAAKVREVLDSSREPGGISGKGTNRAAA